MCNLDSNWQYEYNLNKSEKPAGCLGLDFTNVYVNRTWVSTGKK